MVWIVSNYARDLLSECNKYVEYYVKIWSGYKVSNPQIIVSIDDSVEPNFNNECELFNSLDDLDRRVLIFLNKGNPLSVKKYLRSNRIILIKKLYQN